jgi:hypothetical protein
MKGKIVVHRYESRILKSNPLKDPHILDVMIYLPPGYSLILKDMLLFSDFQVLVVKGGPY